MSAPTRVRQSTSLVAEAAFRARIDELGAAVIGEYVNNRTRVDVVCSAGHACSPRPGCIMRGRGPCRICGGNDPATTAHAFRVRIAELDGQVVGEYIDARTPVDCICPDGHPCQPRPGGVLAGQGMCVSCGHVTRNAAKKERGKVAFLKRIAELKGTLTGEYAGAHVPVSCICPAGHLCWPTPHGLQRGYGLCDPCGQLSRVVTRMSRSETRFRARIVGLGGQVVGPYVNSRTPVDCICPDGHQCSPTPGNTMQGVGICRICKGMTWDVFYVVVNPALGRVKFGVTSGHPQGRLRVHRRAGYTTMLRTLPDLPGALSLEQHVRATLRDAGVPALQGREYFPETATALVLDIVDGWTS